MTEATAPPLIAHLERHLGRLERGWGESADGRQLPVQVVQFANPTGGVPLSYATLGLSEHVLRMPSGEVRHELLCCGPSDGSLNPAPLMVTVAEDLIASGRSLVKGQVLGPSGPLLEGTELEALYCAAPVYFPDEFAVMRDVRPPVVIVWLVPISRSEAAFVRDRGWDAFEDLLLERDPNLLDWGRPSLV